MSTDDTTIPDTEAEPGEAVPQQQRGQGGGQRMMRGPGGQPMRQGQGIGQGMGGRPQQIDPRAVDPQVNEGKAAFEKGDATLAELRAMQALQIVPDHLEALILLYQCRRKAGQAGPAVENVLRRIVRRDPNILWATTELAFMLFARGERVECEGHVRATPFASRPATRRPTA